MLKLLSFGKGPLSYYGVLKVSSKLKPNLSQCQKLFTPHAYLFVANQFEVSSKMKVAGNLSGEIIIQAQFFFIGRKCRHQIVTVDCLQQ